MTFARTVVACSGLATLLAASGCACHVSTCDDCCDDEQAVVQTPYTANATTVLFNGRDMSGWSFFLNDAADPKNTWSVQNGVIHCTGTPAGYMQTRASFEDFVLTLEWRWAGQPGNSGVLLRKAGDDKTWPDSLEAQLQHGNAGDFWKIGGVHAEMEPSRTNGNNVKKLADAENPVGEWNRYVITVRGGDVALEINGQRVNSAWNVTRRAGPICLQSEGAPIEFRNIEITPL
ncbi:MAG: DUF1080 domain-containing protein [Phycisphaeraceae bacterium]|nr:DUF1080 domain-containing protein [Phycisphaeraceae bacterium]